MQAKIASKQRASLHALQVDRETLKKRWEVAEHLRLERITNRLAELNQHFTMPEEAHEDSFAKIASKKRASLHALQPDRET